MSIENYDQRTLVRRRDVVVCAHCGEDTPRRSHRQKYCSDECKEKARTRVRKSFLGSDTGAPTKAKKKRRNFNVLQGRKSGSTVSISLDLWHVVVDVEIFAGRRWAKVTSDDGVVCLVSTFKPRATRP